MSPLGMALMVVEGLVNCGASISKRKFFTMHCGMRLANPQAWRQFLQDISSFQQLSSTQLYLVFLETKDCQRPSATKCSYITSHGGP